MAMIGRNATIAYNGEYRCRQEEKFDALGRGYWRHQDLARSV